MQYNNHPLTQTETMETATTQQALNVDSPVKPVTTEFRQRFRPVFSGFEDHSIELNEASMLTKNYRKQAGRGSTKGQFFSRAAIEQLLLQEEVVGVRYYYTRDREGKLGLVLVGVQESGDDLHNGFISGNGIPTSPFCTDRNPLNS